ncbi:MAG TPA: hypothetical protein DDZ88_06145 [Verrucomicrobiales bacterium]|nr:hypothetical protein [Verrucomicrobiales bacterium]
MKTFLRKLKLSFLAMLCGWIACNIAWWVGAILSMDATALQHLDLRQTGVFAIMVGIYTAIIIAMAWLAIFLPVDLCIKDESTLRNPKMAALLGFLAAFSLVASVYGYVAWFEVTHHGFAEGLWRTLDKAALPYALGTCASGCMAAYVRARMDQPTR